MSTENTVVSVVEFFSGIGGMHYALSKSEIPFDVVAAFDINTIANDVYRHNFPSVNVLSRNIQGMKTKDLDKLKADTWTMSPPCQPFTRLGKRKDLGDNRTGALQQIVAMFSEMVYPPRAILLENVKGFENSDARNLFVSALKTRNYGFKEYLLNPLQFGIPNSRLRYYLLSWKLADTLDQSAGNRSLESTNYIATICKEISTLQTDSKPAKTVNEYLENDADEEYLQSFLVEDKVLVKQAGVLDIVTPDSKQCCCFTRSYSQYAEGTGSVLYEGDLNTLEESFSKWRQTKDETERLNLIKPLRLRYFTPREVANIMGFPQSFDPSLTRLTRSESDKRTLRRYSHIYRDDRPIQDGDLSSESRDVRSPWLIKDNVQGTDRSSFVPLNEFMIHEQRRSWPYDPKKNMTLSNNDAVAQHLTEGDQVISHSTVRTVRQTTRTSQDVESNLVRQMDGVEVDGSLTNLPLMMHKATICNEGFVPTFIRVPRSMIMGIPTIVSTIEVVTCSQYCRNNTEPTSGTRRLCQGFNYQDSNAPTCEFFDGQAQLGPLNRNVGPRSFYYDKICLSGAEECAQRPYAFEALPNSQLLGNVIKSIVVEDESSCLSACLAEQEFSCQSVNYVRDRKVCEMSRFSRRSKLQDFSVSVPGVDYYENNCLTKQNRCTAGEMYFVKTFDSEIAGFDITEGVETLNSCLEKCLESEFIFCRSVEYDRSTNECLVSDEDSFSVPEMVNSAQAVGIDLYEPVCLPGGGDVDINCQRPYLFEKIVRAELSSATQSFRVLNGMTPEDCMNTCAREIRCRSMNYNVKTQTCVMSELDRRNSTAQLVEAQNVDYYENNCRKGPRERNLTQILEAQRQEPREFACEFTLRENNRELKPFFRNDLVKVDNLGECQLMCQSIQSYDCLTMSYSERRKLCGLSQLDLKDYPLDTLTQVDPDFKFYLKGHCAGSTRSREPDESEFNRVNEIVTPPSQLPVRERTPTQRRTQPGPFTIDGGLQRLLPETVEVNALCSSDGVNVSVTTTNFGGYTGAIYAAERFSFCRNLVTAQSGFWLFLPRPSINSACNTIMVNDVLSGVVVISNDNVIPYDVTTKDDMFYQVSCDFSGAALSDGGKVVVTGGLVVGGPTPRVVAGAGVPSTFDATLRILRGGLPVQNVLIGEQLSLNIDSSIDSVRMMLMQCNVSRIGGSGPLPDPLTIVDNGCPIVSQVIGPIERTPQGLQAPLTAFRIDGSAEIQIVCVVMFCPQQCAPVACPRPDGDSFQSLGRKKRELELSPGEPDEQPVVESVNGRLRVHNPGEEGAPLEDSFRSRDLLSKRANCVPEATFVAVTAVLGLLVALLMTSLACMLCRRSWMVALQHKLLTEHIGRAMSRGVPDSPRSHQIHSPCSSNGSNHIRSVHHTQRGRPALLRTSEM